MADKKAAKQALFGREFGWRESQPFEFTPEIEKALKKNKKAWNNFTYLAPSYRKEYILWLLSAKREETKQKRLKKAIKLLEINQKLGMR